MRYKASYLYSSGGIEYGDCIYAPSDADAVLMAQARAKCKRANLFGLHECTGTADDESDLVRPVTFKFTASQATS